MQLPIKAPRIVHRASQNDHSSCFWHCIHTALASEMLIVQGAAQEKEWTEYAAMLMPMVHIAAAWVGRLKEVYVGWTPAIQAACLCARQLTGTWLTGEA